MLWLALACVGLAGTVAYLFQLATTKDTEAEVARQTAEKELYKKLFQSEADRRHRLEDLVRNMRDEIISLEKDLATVAVPGVARERLNKLLAHPPQS